MRHQFDIALSFATENQPLVDEVYHYLRAEGYNVFFAPSPEGQAFISGKNQNQIFYQIFGWDAEYVALFVTKDYIGKKVPMKEASIALTKRAGNDTVIPIYLDGAELPTELFDPKQRNYYRSSNAVAIAAHLADRCRPSASRTAPLSSTPQPIPQSAGGMYVSGNTAQKQAFIQNHYGTLEL